MLESWNYLQPYYSLLVPLQHQQPRDTDTMCLFLRARMFPRTECCQVKKASQYFGFGPLFTVWSQVLFTSPHSNTTLMTEFVISSSFLLG